MIREERDPAFWIAIASDPFVSPALDGHAPATVGPLIGQESTTPLASENGGFLFIRMMPGAYELHALYRVGCARETTLALKLALQRLDPDLCLVQETASPLSRPPLSFGFRKYAGAWLLTRAAWLGSPARKRMI